MDAKQVTVFAWLSSRITGGYGYLPDIEDILNHMIVHRVVYPESEATEQLWVHHRLAAGSCGSVTKNSRHEMIFRASGGMRGKRAESRIKFIGRFFSI